jgi:hypothetical protein
LTQTPFFIIFDSHPKLGCYLILKKARLNRRRRINNIVSVPVEKSRNICDFIIKTLAEVTMKKEKEQKELKKRKYHKPVVTKHKKLMDITAGASGTSPAPS